MADQLTKKEDVLLSGKNKQKITDKRDSIDTDSRFSDDDESGDEDTTRDENRSQENSKREEAEEGSGTEEESDNNKGNGTNSEKNESRIPSSPLNNMESKNVQGNESSSISPISPKNTTPKYPPVEHRKPLSRMGVPEVHKEKPTSDWRTLDHRKAIAVLVIPIILGSVMFFYWGDNMFSFKSTEFKCTTGLNCNKLFLEEMGNKYPQQQLASFKLYSRLVDLAVKGSRPEDINVVFTLLYNETHRNAYIIAKDMASFAAEKFNKSSRIIEIYGSDPSIDFTSSNSMKTLTKELMEKGAMVVYDFDQISTHKVRKFHAICDKYTPFVNNQMVYILVLKTPRLNHTEDLSDRDLKMLAGLRMEELWSDMEDTSLKPLIVRLTENIIQIKS